MRKLKQFTAMICLLAIVITTGCQNGAASPVSTDSPTNPTVTKKPESTTEPTFTYTSMRNLGIAEYPSDGGEAKVKILESLAEAGITGFDYNVSLASGTEYYTKLNLLASSNDLPDIFDIDPPTLMRFVDQGLLLPLDDYLKNSPNLLRMIPQERWDSVTFDGKIYAIPNGRRPDPINTDNAASILLRQDWLDAVGLKQPSNLDELYEVLKAFKAKDPDKTGNVGFGGTKDSRFNTVFGAFGISPTFWTVRDGMIKKGMVLSEAKEALAVLHKWYKEGLIDPDFPIIEAKQLNEKIINSKVGLWEGNGFLVHPPTDPTAEALNKANPNSQITLIETPEGPNGHKGHPAARPGIRAISAKVENPEKLFQFLDWIVDDSDNGGLSMILYGIEGVDYTYDRSQELVIQHSSYAELYAKGYSNPMRMVAITDRRYAVPEVREALALAGKNLIENALWRTLPAEIDYPDLESKLWTEYFIKIVTGVYTIDKFDEFVEKYYNQGGLLIEQQANTEWQKLKK